MAVDVGRRVVHGSIEGSGVRPGTGMAGGGWSILCLPGAGGHPGEGGLRGALGNTCFLEKKMVEWRNSGSHSPGQPQGDLGDG